jgi:hypothetical protein
VLISGLLYPIDGRAGPELSGVGDLEGDVAIAMRQRSWAAPLLILQKRRHLIF